MKAKDLHKELNKSQKINVESPRFIKTLERALTLLFTEADATNDGQLTYSQFFEAFKRLPTYDLCENDIRVLLALADENKVGNITWAEFIPVGIDAIKTFLARNKDLQKQSAAVKEINKECLMFVFETEI
jgi:Ca2+-binding EF-hand superfamily protein